ncbi:MAG TPA: alcohol dehydrogenase [Bdellovibrionales bacterium]|nr:MAG: hypothetical protein A2X97_08635 [Bdellovibrionales bacterium GWA1_52_35]HAR44100.1 alcohol dehydrogenase [Bdellovibrionales bacterium]HCM41638.1 alcohol dehydrogenase [Bdellovibrionales bacterium]
MKTNILGQTNLSVSCIGLGTMNFGALCDERESHRILNAFTSAGGNLIDTANVYSLQMKESPHFHSRGSSEQFIGSWLKVTKKRNQIILATKVGMEMNDAYPGLSGKAIKFQVEQSLKRLQTDYIDLYQAHCDSTSESLFETVQAFNDLKKEGKIRHFGCSNYSGSRLAESFQVARDHNLLPYSTTQSAYSLLRRIHVEQEILPSAQKAQMGIIAYKALGGGFLTGKYRPDSPIPDSPNSDVIVRRAFNEPSLKLVKTLEQIATPKEASVAQVTLAWYLNQSFLSSVLVGARSAEQLEQLLKANTVPLSQVEIERIDIASKLCQP